MRPHRVQRRIREIGVTYHNSIYVCSVSCTEVTTSSTTATATVLVLDWLDARSLRNYGLLRQNLDFPSLAANDDSVEVCRACLPSHRRQVL